MRRVNDDDLDHLEELLEQLTALSLEYPVLKCRKKGVYSLKSKAFLHFHEDEGLLFADVKLDGSTFDRFKVTTKQEQTNLASKIQGVLTR
jgi:hypothetical protein